MPAYGMRGRFCRKVAVSSIPCVHGFKLFIRFLLERGAPVTRTNRDDESCLFSALPFPQLINVICNYVKSNTSENRFGK